MRNTIRVLLVSVFLFSAPLTASAGTPTDLLGVPKNLLGTPRMVAVADTPVVLSDAQSFEAPLVLEIDDDEIAVARQELVNAVSAEKFLDGAVAVLVAGLLLAIVF